MKTAIAPLALLSALAAPAVFAADDIFRSVLPDGRVVYGESPFPGAKIVDRIPPPPASTGTVVVSPAEKARGAQSLPDRGPGGVVVLPHAPRESPSPAQQGRALTNRQLPKPAY